MDPGVMRMVLQHERTLDTAQQRLGFALGLRKAVSALSIALTGKVVRILVDHAVTRLRDQAVWFKGAAAKIDGMDRRSSVDPAFELVNRLRALEDRWAERLRELPTELVELRSAVQELREAFSDVRGAIQAHEADCFAMSGGLRRPLAAQTAFDSEAGALAA